MVVVPYQFILEKNYIGLVLKSGKHIIVSYLYHLSLDCYHHLLTQFDFELIGTNSVNCVCHKPVEDTVNMVGANVFECTFVSLFLTTSYNDGTCIFVNFQTRGISKVPLDDYAWCGYFNCWILETCQRTFKEQHQIWVLCGWLLLASTLL